MARPKALAPVEDITRAILVLRGHRVILDADLAALYGVTTKRLDVKRNGQRFPDDFMFRLNGTEVEVLNRSQFATGSQKHRDPRFPPFAFTEHGAIMAATILNSSRAVEMSLYVVRAFVRLRAWQTGGTLLAFYKDPAKRAEVKILWTSPLIPRDPLVWRKDLPEDVKAKIKTFVTTYGKDDREKAILKGMQQIAGFKESSNAQLIPIRQLELARDRAKIASDTTLSDADKAVKTRDIDARLAELAKQLK